LPDERPGREGTRIGTDLARSRAIACAPRIERTHAHAEVVGRDAAQRIARFDERGDVAGAADVFGFGAKDHRRESRMQREIEHAPAERRDAAVAIERAERVEQVARLSDRARRRRVEPAELRGSPRSKLECELRELDLRDLGRAIGVEALAFGPESQREPGPETSGAAGALIGGSLRDRNRFEPREAGIRIEARLAREAGVDDGAHAGQGQARFGDVRREDDAACAGGRGRQCRVLFLQRELTMQSDELDLKLRGYREIALTPAPLPQAGERFSWFDDRAREHRARAFDLALAGQEHEHVAVASGERFRDRATKRPRIALVRARRHMRDAHRKAAAFARKTRRIEPALDARAGERRRHDHEAQIGPEIRLHVERERGAEIAVEMPLVELVEQDRADVAERGVVLDHPRQDAFGDDLDACRRRDATLEADAIADRRSDRFAALRGHEFGGSTRGDASWFEHQDLAAAEPRGIEQRRRHLRRLAGAGRRFEHEPRMHFERALQRIEQRSDRKVGARRHACGIIGVGIRAVCGNRARDCHPRKTDPAVRRDRMHRWLPCEKGYSQLSPLMSASRCHERVPVPEGPPSIASAEPE
jgi:hypothetical protein